MARGIIYVMTTVVPGLIKIGKTDVNNFNNRMYGLERHGYANVTGLSREFAIELDDYDEKEKLLNEIFSKSRVPNTELFALDIDLVTQLLSSFEGDQIYPKEDNKKQIFKNSTNELKDKSDIDLIPDGKYTYTTKVRTFGKVSGTMVVEDGVLILKSGSVCAPYTHKNPPKILKSAIFDNNILQNDLTCTSPSNAAKVVRGKNQNGWTHWKNKDGKPIDIYRSK